MKILFILKDYLFNIFFILFYNNQNPIWGEK